MTDVDVAVGRHLADELVAHVRVVGADGARLVDPDLGGDASLCSQSQLAGLLCLLGEADDVALARRLVVDVERRQRPGDGFPSVYNRPPQGAPWHDLAEVGAAAPGLLQCWRRGVVEARTVLERAAAHCRARKQLPGVFRKNDDSAGVDVLNGDAYAAACFAALYEITREPALLAEVAEVADHLATHLGAHGEDEWVYSVDGKAAVVGGFSVAYQATVVGLGSWWAGGAPDEVEWRAALARAARRAAGSLERGDRDDEWATWVPDWSTVPEICWLAAVEGVPAPSVAAVVEEALSDAGRTPVPGREGRTALKTPVRVAANCAASLVLLRTRPDLRLEPLTGVVDAERYLSRHADDASRPGTARWAYTLVEDGAVEVELPNRVRVHLDRDAGAWVHGGRAQEQSTLLWEHSLGFLPTLEHDGRSEYVDAVLESYDAFVRTPAGADLLASMTSLDHSVAVRLRALCTLACQRRAVGRPQPAAVERLVRHAVAWARQPGRIAGNNHGMMLAAALAHAHLLWPHVVSPSVVAEATRRLREIIGGAFDEAGVCRENTPAYQAFYLRFARTLVAFVDDVGSVGEVADLGAFLTAVVDAGEATLRVMVRPDRTFAPVGDSGAERADVDPARGVVVSEESGAYYRNEADWHVVARCGSSSHVHKHMDDTAVSLWVAGDDLILDGGLHNYDWRDPVTVAVKSQRGHSGLVFPRFDDLYPGAVHRPGVSRVRSELQVVRGGDVDTLVCSSSIDDVHRVRRVVEVTDGALRLMDSFESPTDVAVQRFLLPASAEVTVGEGEVGVRSDHAWLHLRFDPRRSVARWTGATDEGHRGWVSRSWGSAEPCHMVDIAPVDGETVMWASVTFGARTDG